MNYVSNRELVEKQLAQTQKLATLGLLISSIAHEACNLNNCITFNTPILREYLNEVVPIMDSYAKKCEDLKFFGIPYPDFRREIFGILDSIERASSRIAATVSGLRVFARGNSGESQRCTDLKQAVENVVVICRGQIREAVKSFEVNIADDLPLVFADPVSLEQALVNLLINAVQATNGQDSWVRINAKQRNGSQGHVIVEVSDNGCGIDEEIKGKIFEPFFTTKAFGTGAGLGLFVSKILVEGMGGSLEVESRLGEGSTFGVILRCELQAD
jgi:C4-dicarboxylate-specific signal transduction histidine kinase